jgi:hypothetical protein
MAMDDYGALTPLCVTVWRSLCCARVAADWLHNCGGPDATTLTGCTYGEDYASMVKVVQGKRH